MTTQFAVALVTPLTGPQASDGLAGLRGASLWARDALLPPPWDEVTLTAYDAHPDPAAAMASAQASEPYAVLGPFGSASALAAATSTRRLIFNHGAPTSRFVRQSFPNVVNLAAPASTWAREALDAIRSADRSVRRVALLAGPGEGALETVATARSAAAARGFEVAVWGFRPGRAAVAARRLPPAEVLIVDADADDEREAADVLLDRPWRAAAFSTAGDSSAIASLGARADGVLGPRAWLPDTSGEVMDGPTAAQFGALYREEHGAEPGPLAAAAYAAGVIIGRCVRASAGSTDTALGGAARGLDTSTLYGRFRLDPATGLQVGHRVRTVQWHDGESVVVWPRAAGGPRPRPRGWQATRRAG